MTKKQVNWVMSHLEGNGFIYVVDDDTSDGYEIVEVGQLERLLKGKKVRSLQGRNMMRIG